MFTHPHYQTIKRLAQRLVDGERDLHPRVIVKQHTFNPDYFTLCYSRDSQRVNEWSEEEQACRGVIIDSSTGEIVALPFPKFFNLYQKDTVPNRGTTMKHVFEKMDGSLGILYRCNGQYRIATKGSDTSDHAIWATEFLTTNYDLVGLDDSITLLFEIIGEVNEKERVVEYGYEDLVLIGAYDRFTGLEYSWSVLQVFSNMYGFPLPDVYDFNSMSDIIEATGKVYDKIEEGWVVQFSDGLRIKFKRDDYVQMHKAKAHFSEAVVLEAWYSDNVDELYRTLPDEIHYEIDYYVNGVNEAYFEYRRGLLSYMQEAPQDSDKAFALYVNSEVEKKYRTGMFMLYRGKKDKLTEHFVKRVY